MLNTSVESPHEKTVTAMEFSCQRSVDNLLCATAGHDRTIRLWALEQSQNIHRKFELSVG